MVLLLSPASRAFNHYRPPLALMCLAGFLKKEGVFARIVDIPFEKQVRDGDFESRRLDYQRDIEEKILKQVKDSPADIIGFSCYSTEVFEVEALAGKIRKLKPHATLVVGGIHPTLQPEDMLGEGSCFDFAVVGEGELTMVELVRAIREGRTDYSSINGVAWRNRVAGRVEINPPRHLADDLDRITSPDFDGVDMRYYTTASPYAIRGVFSRSFYVSSSRGCPSSCSFCVSKTLRQHFGTAGFLRVRSPESLFEEVRLLRRRYGIDSFYFIDDLFTIKKKPVLEFCQLLARHEPAMIWGCSSRVNTVDEQMLSAMKRAGCVQIDFGVEKGSDRALATLQKGITVAQIKSAFSQCHRLGIRTFANFLINTPGEKEEDLNDILRLAEEIRPHIVSMNIFMPYPGCEIFDGVASRIPREFYPLMTFGEKAIVEKPEVFCFSEHRVDLTEWTRAAMRKYNRFGANGRILMDPRYLRSLVRSGNRVDYARQTMDLTRELINQKFG